MFLYNYSYCKIAFLILQNFDSKYIQTHFLWEKLYFLSHYSKWAILFYITFYISMWNNNVGYLTIVQLMINDIGHAFEKYIVNTIMSLYLYHSLYVKQEGRLCIVKLEMKITKVNRCWQWNYKYSSKSLIFVIFSFHIVRYQRNNEIQSLKLNNILLFLAFIYIH